MKTLADYALATNEEKLAILERQIAALEAQFGISSECAQYLYRSGALSQWIILLDSRKELLS